MGDMVRFRSEDQGGQDHEVESSPAVDYFLDSAMLGNFLTTSITRTRTGPAHKIDLSKRSLVNIFAQFSMVPTDENGLVAVISRSGSDNLREVGGQFQTGDVVSWRGSNGLV